MNMSRDNSQLNQNTANEKKFQTSTNQIPNLMAETKSKQLLKKSQIVSNESVLDDQSIQRISITLNNPTKSTKNAQANPQ